MMTEHLIESLSTLQEYCCSGGYRACAQTVAEAYMPVVGRVLCLFPGSVGHLTNQPQEIRTMGRWVGQFPCFHSTAGLIPMFPFYCWSDSHVSIPPLVPVVTGASEGIGRGYALEVSMTSLCVAVSSVTHMI